MGSTINPQDLETTARESHPLLEAGLGAAFAVEHPAGQRLILVHEVTRNWEMQFTPVLDAVRKAVIEEHGVSLHSIVLVRCGTIPKTSSGKVQRRACRSALLAGTLHSLAAFHSQATPTVAAMDAHATPLDSHDAILSTHTGPPSADSSVFATVCQHALAFGGAALSGITPDTPLTALGLDSLQRVELAAALERAFTCRLPDKEFNPEQTLGELARAVQASARASSAIGLRAVRIAVAHHDIARFPEYVELKRYERMLKAVAGDHPYFRVDEGGTGCTSVARIAGRDVLNFGVYDYIGLSRHPDVVSAAKAAIDRYGTSSGASRLVSGEKQVHQDLEWAIADFLETPAAIVFVSGHATNVTTIGHLLGPEDLIVHDALAHNSIIQGAQLSGATRRAFPHNDWQALDSMLTEVRHRYRRVLIAIEGVYSMDGDFPNLPRFVELKKDHKALILVDEAHSLGTMGSTGRGIGEHWGVARRDVDLWMGTLSKTLGSCGGYVAGSAELIELLRYTAPGFVYSVGLAPSNAAAALAALTVLRAEPHRVTRLHELSALFLREATRRGLNTGLAAGTPVIPVVVGSSVKSLRMAGALHRRGINVQPILHPAVPEHSSRFRFFVTANHNEVQIRDTVRIFADELATL
ncbi:MAG: aminotransferase class I/II-fold pyridoxal phosphate-dependent enzyme [Phycisphaeraceae bacterium]|nr:aminotransferase class I/II-fold pyridoxal phosphate-dependent enzyme [Phycisphaeraceae bacterium]